MENAAALVISSASIGLSLLAAWLLFERGRRSRVYIPLAVFFVIFALLNSEDIVLAVKPVWESAFIIVLISMALALWPTLWLYIEGITSETRWKFERRHLSHMSPVLIGLITAALIAALPSTIRDELLLGGDIETSTGLVVGTMVALLIFFLFWFCQTGFYLFIGFRRLFAYRRHLKDVFASTDRRELSWLVFLFLFWGTLWGIGIIDLFADQDLLSASWNNALNFGFLFSLAAWGLRQAPGYEEIYIDEDQEKASLPQGEAAAMPAQPSDTDESVSKEAGKYEKSAMDPQRAERIAEKLERTMHEKGLYLNPDLSLPVLAQHVGVSRNVLSQVLNEKLESCFFDYVNKHRITASFDQLRENDQTILAIAMDVGFNSRSAFYKAFKRETGTTPSKYREQLTS